MKITLEEARKRGENYMDAGYHCGPSVLRVMSEALGMTTDDMQWAGTNFYGGITRHREGVCGAVSAMAVCLGFLYRCPPGDPQKTEEAIAASRAKTNDLVQSFKDEFGGIVCQELLGITDFNEEERKQFFEQKKYRTQCNGYVCRVIEKLYELGA